MRTDGDTAVDVMKIHKYGKHFTQYNVGRAPAKWRAIHHRSRVRGFPCT